MLALGGPEDPPPAPMKCMWGNGTGVIPNDYRECYEPCDMCAGTGIRPARRPQASVAAQAAA